MDETYVKIFAVLFFISGMITTSLGWIWLTDYYPISRWTFDYLWVAWMRSYLVLWLYMLLGVGLMGVAVYLHRKAKK